MNGKLTVNKPKTKTSDRTIILPKSVVGVPAELIKQVRTEITKEKAKMKEGDL